MAEPALSEGLPAFAMVPIGPDGLVLEALRSGTIEHADVAVLWAVMAGLNWRSGRCWQTAPELAAALGCRLDVVELAIGRLVAAGLLAIGRHRRRQHQPFICANPAILTTGGPYRRRHQWVQFHRHAVDPAAVEALAAAAGATRSPLAA